MQITEVKANTLEWKEARKNYVGASEIYSLIYYYCYPELKQISHTLGYQVEKPWKSAYEIWHKIKYGNELEMKNQEDAFFGHEMEKYIIDWQNFPSSQTGLFIINPELHKLAACSPDLLLDDKSSIIELKTSRFVKEQKPKLKYIFQLQYQMMICEVKKGKLVVAFSKDPKFDTDFQRGYILGILDSDRYSFVARQLPVVYFDTQTFEFKTNSEIQELCFKALECLNNDLSNNNPPSSVNPETQEIDLAFWNQDLRLMTIIGEIGESKDIRNTELDLALEDFKHGKEQIAAIKAELAQNSEYLIRRELLSHAELVGNNFRAYYDRGNKLKVTKL